MFDMRKYRNSCLGIGNPTPKMQEPKEEEEAVEERERERVRAPK